MSWSLIEVNSSMTSRPPASDWATKPPVTFGAWHQLVGLSPWNVLLSVKAYCSGCCCCYRIQLSGRHDIDPCLPLHQVHLVEPGSVKSYQTPPGPNKLYKVHQIAPGHTRPNKVLPSPSCWTIVSRDIDRDKVSYSMGWVLQSNWITDIIE